MLQLAEGWGDDFVRAGRSCGQTHKDLLERRQHIHCGLLLALYPFSIVNCRCFPPSCFFLIRSLLSLSFFFGQGKTCWLFSCRSVLFAKECALPGLRWNISCLVAESNNMQSHRKKSSWLTIGVSGCCASRDDVASEKEGHCGMYNKFPFVIQTTRTPSP